MEGLLPEELEGLQEGLVPTREGVSEAVGEISSGAEALGVGLARTDWPMPQWNMRSLSHPPQNPEMMCLGLMMTSGFQNSFVLVPPESQSTMRNGKSLIRGDLPWYDKWQKKFNSSCLKI